MRAILLVLACLLSGSWMPARAWGPEGHSIMAELAQRRLTAPARAAVAELLGPGVSMASVGSWADEWRRAGHRETARWHYVDIDLGEPVYDAARDCRQTEEGDCLPAALARFIAQLGDAARPAPERRQALLFVVHLVGDLTQPLHCTERQHDAGGNRLFVTFEGARERRPQAFRFHALWDDTLIRERAPDWTALVAELEATVLPALDAASVQAGSLEDWTNDCHRAGVAAYGALGTEAPARNDAQTPIGLGTAYAEATRALLDAQLAKGGLRLAEVLNRALGGR